MKKDPALERKKCTEDLLRGGEIPLKEDVEFLQQYSNYSLRSPKERTRQRKKGYRNISSYSSIFSNRTIIS